MSMTPMGIVSVFIGLTISNGYIHNFASHQPKCICGIKQGLRKPLTWLILLSSYHLAGDIQLRNWFLQYQMQEALVRLAL